MNDKSIAKFLLIGPSGVGKSTVLKLLSKDNSLEVFDLDNLIKENTGANSISDYFSEVGSQIFFNKSKEVIERMVREKNILIAVGAGSIDYAHGHLWYSEQFTIALTGDPFIIYERSDRQKFHPTFEGYKAIEFSPARRWLYDNSRYKIDVTDLNPEQVSERVLEVMRKTGIHE